MCDLMVLKYVKCGMVCCAGNVIWCEISVELCWCRRCGMYTLPSCTSSHHCHHSLHCIIPKRHLMTVFHTTSHVTPFLTISVTHFILRQHLSTIPLCNTIFQIAPYRPHYASHHISHCTPFHITFHITPHSMYSTPHFRSHHILATLRTTTCRITSHFTHASHLE